MRTSHVTGRAPRLLKLTFASLLVATTALAAVVLSAGPADASGVAFTPSEAPLPGDASANPDADLFATSCPTAGSCVAVGRYANAGGTQALIETLSAGSWSPMVAPLPSDALASPSADLAGISCPAAGTCVAVGQYSNASGLQALVETLSFGVWTPVAAPLPGDADPTTFAQLAGVSCPATGSCVAAGDYRDGSGNGQGLVESLAGGSWTPSQAPVPGDALAGSFATTLKAISCPAPTSCIAGGDYNNSAGRQGLVESLSSGTWTPGAAPIPAGANPDPYATISSVSCPAAGSCVAVGNYKSGGGGFNDLGLVETLASGSWTPMTAAVPGNAAAQPDAFLAGVTCPAAGTCLAVGNYVDQTAFRRPLFESLSSGAWSATEGSLPSNASSSVPLGFVGAVACPLTGSCVAVGQYDDTGGNTQGLIESGGPASGSLRVYTRAANGHLTEYVNDGLNGKIWNAYDISADAANGGPIVGTPDAFHVGGTVHIYAQGAGGHLMEYVPDGLGGHIWNAYDLGMAARGGVPISGTPDAFFYGGLLHVYGQGPGGHLVEYVNDALHGRIWNEYDITAIISGGAIAGTPDAFLYGPTIHVYAQGAGGDLVEYVNDGLHGQTWNAYDVSSVAGGGATITGTPDAFNVGGSPRIYVQGPGGHLIEYLPDTLRGHIWNAYDLSADAGGGGVVSGTPDAFAFGPTWRIYVQGAGGHLVEYDPDNLHGHIWNAYDLGVAAGGGPTIAGSPDAFYDGATLRVYSQATGNGDLIEYIPDNLHGRIWNAYDVSADAGGGGPLGAAPDAFYLY